VAEIERTGWPTAEIIVVDNASTDRTAEIARGFARVRVIEESMPGVVAARRCGYRAARGSYVANIDADTVIPSGWLSRGLAAFYADPGLVALSGPCDYPGVSPATARLIRSYYLVAWLVHLGVRAARLGSMIQGGNCLILRSALDRATDAFSDRFAFYGEDTELARCLARVGRVRFSLGFRVSSSPRRFQAEGLVRTAFTYLVNYVWTILFKRPHTRGWRNVRT
jgi:glycosyltransferase involved in cell wall biosynthesis